MTVEPLILELGPLRISGFGLLMMIGFVAGAWTFRIELIRRGLSAAYAAEIFIAAGLGGVAGAKLLHLALTGDWEVFLSRGGMIWYGGFVLGFAAVVANGWRRGVPFRFTLEIVGPGLALAYAIGRLGCFAVGDDYGRPTSLPWGIAFPHGLPPTTARSLHRHFGLELPLGTRPEELLFVHPTQLYEAAAMLVIFWILWRLRRHEHGTGWLFAAYLALAGSERFLIELLRLKRDRIFGPLTATQLLSLALVALGLWLMARWRRPDPGGPSLDAKILRR